MSYYSPLKVFHHRDRLDGLRQGKHVPPVHVHLVPTNRCNMSCNFCAYKTPGYSSSETFDPRDEIPTDRLLALCDELDDVGIRAAEFTGGGEPTIHPALHEAFLKLHAAGIDFSLVTNGSRMVDSCLLATWVRVSVDAGNAESYSKIRKVKPDQYDQVRHNLRTIARARREGNPTIGAGFVVTPENWRELYVAAECAREDGADNFRISAQFQNGGSEFFAAFRGELEGIIEQVKRLESDQFKVFDLFNERCDDLRKGPPVHPGCYIQRLVPYIGADQNVYRCCVLAYNERGLLGSIKEQPFWKLWRATETQTRLDEFDARQCPRCMFNAKNDTIRYALNENPPHVNFL